MSPQPASHRIRQACWALAGGGVVALPTEAVWGLSCNPADPAAVQRLLDMKNRPVAKGLILVAADEGQLAGLTDGLSRGQRSRLTLSWPGPATWLIPHRGRVPEWVHGEHDTVAVRVSDHPVIRHLCRAFGGPLVSTSANPAGAQPATAQFQVRRYFGAALDDILPGVTAGGGRPTVIRDLLTERVIRA